MLETILLVYCLLFINTFYLYKLDASKNNNIILLNSQKNDTKSSSNKKLPNIQSAENCKGFSETARQLPEKEDSKFWNWFAGIIDGDGNFDIRIVKVEGKNEKSLSSSNKPLSLPTTNKKVLKQIRIKLHNRDIRILRRIQDYLHIGKIRADKNKPYSIYTVSNKEDMTYLVKNLNGLIRLKVPSFKEACNLYNIDYIEPNYNIELYDSYFAGLVDTDGSIVFNYAGNRIECNLEFQYNEFTCKLNFDNTILNCKPAISIRKKSSIKGNSKNYSSISFKFQNVNSMLFIYDYFMHNRLLTWIYNFLNRLESFSLLGWCWYHSKSNTLKYTISRKPTGKCFYPSRILRDCTSVTGRQGEPLKFLNLNTVRSFHSTRAMRNESHNTQGIKPYFVTGFTDAEGSFIIRIVKSPGYRLGWSIQPIFQIELHKKDEDLLKLIQSYFGVGSVYNSGSRSSVAYKVTSAKDLDFVINHFDKYPLITFKLADYLLFKQVVGMIQLKEHLTKDGVEKIVGIKASINKGISEELKAAFPNVIPVKRPLVSPPVRLKC